MSQPAKTTARAIPHDFDAEKWVLGSIMLDPSQFAHVTATLTADDFFDANHGKIFAAMLALRCISRPPTFELVCEYMRPFDSSLIVGIANSVPHAGHVKHYTEIVAKHGLSRRLITACTELLSDAYDSDEPEQLVRRMQNDAVALAQTGRQYTAPVRLSDAAEKVARALETPEAIDSVNRAAWGLYSVDERLGPLMPGEVAIVAARPGMGKTAWGFQMLRHSAEMDRPAIFVSLEMEASELATRDLSRLADVDSRRIRRGEINDEDIRAIRNAQAEIGDLPLYLWSPAIATLAEIRGVLVNAIAKQGIRLACIDYLSLIEVESHQRKDMRHLQVAALSRGLKRMAKELKIPLVVLQQLNREADNSEPKLGSLRESGAVEQDADVVMFLHHGMDGRTPMPADQRMLLVPKFRAGPMGRITVKWDGRKTQFRDPQAVDCGNYEKIFDDFNAPKAENF
jgi:replicative DNA helicase